MSSNYFSSLKSSNGRPIFRTGGSHCFGNTKLLRNYSKSDGSFLCWSKTERKQIQISILIFERSWVDLVKCLNFQWNRYRCLQDVSRNIIILLKTKRTGIWRKFRTWKKFNWCDWKNEKYIWRRKRPVL